MKPIHRLVIFIESTGLSVPDFAKSINIPYGTLQKAIERESDLKDDTLAKIQSTYPTFNMLWVVMGDDYLNGEYSAVNSKQKQLLIEEPDVLFVYDLLNKLKIDETDLNQMAEIKREIVRLFSIHNKVKDQLSKLRNIIDQID